MHLLYFFQKKEVGMDGSRLGREAIIEITKHRHWGTTTTDATWRLPNGNEASVHVVEKGNLSIWAQSDCAVLTKLCLLDAAAIASFLTTFFVGNSALTAVSVAIAGGSLATAIVLSGATLALAALTIYCIAKLILMIKAMGHTERTEDIQLKAGN